MITVCIPTHIDRHARLIECIDSVSKNSDIEHKIFAYKNSLGGWGPAVHAMMEMLDPSDLVVVIGDDCLPQEGWLKPLVDKFMEVDSPDCLIQPNDGIWDGQIASYPCATARYISKWLPKEYNHYFGDTEMAIVAKTRGVYHFVEESMVYHNNPDKDEKLKDHVYDLESKSAKEDENIFNIRREVSNGFINWQNIYD